VSLHDAGTLQKALNDLIDDYGKPFMTVFYVPGKKTAVTVKRTGKIKKKALCLSTDLEPAFHQTLPIDVSEPLESISTSD
jgi:hypothetical protein